MSPRPVLWVLMAAAALALVAVLFHAAAPPAEPTAVAAVQVLADPGAPVPVEAGARSAAGGPIGVALIAWGAVLVLGAASWAARDA
jgi:hypothetical protein